MKSLHHASLQVLQLLLGSLLIEFILDLGLVFCIVTCVFIKVFAELGESGLKILKNAGTNATSAIAATKGSTAALRLDLFVEHGQLLVQLIDPHLVIVSLCLASLALGLDLGLISFDCLLIGADSLFHVANLFQVVFDLLFNAAGVLVDMRELLFPNEVLLDLEDVENVCFNLGAVKILQVFL